jgi:pyruvate kinase
MVEALARAGADVFRLNFSHGAHEDHAAAAANVRAAEAAVERPLALLADLQGPKLRLGRFEGGRAELAKGVASASPWRRPWAPRAARACRIPRSSRRCIPARTS